MNILLSKRWARGLNAAVQRKGRDKMINIDKESRDYILERMNDDKVLRVYFGGFG
jgi:uncharacterized protein YfeS